MMRRSLQQLSVSATVVHIPLCDTELACCVYINNFFICYLYSHLFQTSMKVKQKFTTAALKQFLTAPRDPLIAHASLDIKEMDITVQVMFEVVWSVRSALFRNIFVALSLFLLLFIFLLVSVFLFLVKLVVSQCL